MPRGCLWGPAGTPVLSQSRLGGGDAVTAFWCRGWRRWCKWGRKGRSLLTCQMETVGLHEQRPGSLGRHRQQSEKGWVSRLASRDRSLRGQDGDGVRTGAGTALAFNTSSSFPDEPPEGSGNIIPVYCALLATVVLGLLAYVAFKCWRSHKQRRQLAKARTAELGGLDRDQRHENSVFLDSPSDPSQGPQYEPGCRLYLHLPRQQQEEAERLLEVSGEADRGWRGLAGRLGYPPEAVETMAQGQTPAYTLLRDWATQEGSRATLRVLEEVLAAMGREDVVQALSPPAEGCSVV